MAAFVNFLLVGCLLYLSSSLGDASLARITSLTGQVVEQSIAGHVQRSAFSHGKQSNRYKREVQHKKLEDPKGCIKECGEAESTEMLASMMKNMARLVSLALEGIKGDEDSTPEKEEAFTKDIEAKTIANMGPLFEDLCKIQKNKIVCLSKCPDSQARKILTINTEEGEAVFCEPSMNWNNFSEYWTAMNCTNSTELEKPCESKCGPSDQTIHNVTNLDIDEQDSEDEDDEKSSSASPITLTYETDAKKNTAAVGPVCKTVSCNIGCYKKVISDRCGSKAFDMYTRMTRLEPTSSLKTLKILEAVNSNDDCKAFQ